MSTPIFPFLDVSVWVALAHSIHPHHRPAMAWAELTDRSASFYLCRLSQIGVLRTLTTHGAMAGDVMTQAEAWQALDRLAAYWDAVMLEEPLGFEEVFRKATMRDEVSPMLWADAYLGAFAQGHQLNLVTFDKALAGRSKGSILLQG